MGVQYVVDENGKRVGVILPVEEYERMVEELENIEDVRLYDEAKAAQQRGEFEVVPLEQAMQEIREGKVTADCWPTRWASNAGRKSNWPDSSRECETG